MCLGDVMKCLIGNKKMGFLFCFQSETSLQYDNVVSANVWPIWNIQITHKRGEGMMSQ